MLTVDQVRSGQIVDVFRFISKAKATECADRFDLGGKRRPPNG